VQQAARGPALDAQAGHRRERQERDRRIEALAVGVLVALGERDAAERRAGQLLQTMIDRPRTAFAAAGGVAWLGDTSKGEAEHPSQECTEARLYEISGL
jgi:hypothetical protein